MIFRKKNIFIVLLLFIAFGLNLNATTSEDLEVFTAFLRIPAVMGANIVGDQKGVAPKKGVSPKGVAPKGVAPKVMVIAADLIRLSNEILSIVNKHGEYDQQTYNYFWSAYDSYSLFIHIKNFSKKPLDEFDEIEGSDSVEINELEKLTQLMHEIFLPLVEGACAFLQSGPRTPDDIQSQRLTNRYSAISSLARTLDNLIVSEVKSTERYAYIILLVANILEMLRYEKSEASRQEEADRQQRARDEEWQRFFEDFFGNTFGFNAFGADAPDEFQIRRACEALGISQEQAGDAAVIRKAFRKRALETHPDKHLDDPLAPEKFKRVNEAYNLLLPK